MKQGKKRGKRSPLTHPRKDCPLPPQRVALVGVSSGAAEEGQTVRRSPCSAVLGLQARVRPQRHDARAVGSA
jgi:hypothetical protein